MWPSSDAMTKAGRRGGTQKVSVNERLLLIASAQRDGRFLLFYLFFIYLFFLLFVFGGGERVFFRRRMEERDWGFCGPCSCIDARRQIKKKKVERLKSERNNERCSWEKDVDDDVILWATINRLSLNGWGDGRAAARGVDCWIEYKQRDDSPARAGRLFCDDSQRLCSAHTHTQTSYVLDITGCHRPGIRAHVTFPTDVIGPVS